MAEQILLCDLSLAPQIRLSLATPGRRPNASVVYTCPERAIFDDSVRSFLGERQQPALIGAAFASRGWEQSDGLHMLGGFGLSRDDVRGLLDVQRVNFLNNFVARALAVPGLRRTEKQQISGGDIHDEHVIAVLGPHHGLGLAALVSDGAGGWSALHGEGGHSDLPVKTEREWRIVEAIRARTGYVSRESGMSVAGLMDIWSALHTLAGETAETLTPAQIIDAARAGHPRAIEAIDTMTAWLGAMASDIALIMGARGGIYLTGALLDMIGDLFKTDIFNARFHDKGPLSDYVRDIPVYRTEAPDLELIGLASLFD